MTRRATSAVVGVLALVLVLAGAAAAAPTLTLPGDLTVEAQGPAGAVVTYTATATNPAGKPLQVSCTHPSGSTFPLGATTVTCSVGDESGSVTGSFVLTVVDTAAPAISGAPSASVEATGPTGATATYALPTAADTVDGSVPVGCTPASGSTFPIGTTSVTCTATDAAGNTATASGAVDVLDRTPPALTPPPPLTVRATSAAGIAASDPSVAAFLSGAAATDTVTAAPQVVNDAPTVLPVGTTTVRFTASDGAGNATSAASTVTVTAAPAGTVPTTPPTPPPAAADPGAADRIPPANVTGVRARRVGSGAVSITWRLPTDADFALVRVFRSLAADATVPATMVYEGSGISFRDTRLRNGVVYRYLVISVDRTGNPSGGVAFTIQPRAALLWAPTDGARIATRPLFVWARVSRASYYNVQVFRGGRKIFTAWPKTTRLRMPASWRFGGKRYGLTPGTYRWYVWPGYGARANARYGQVLGTSTFTVVAR